MIRTKEKSPLASEFCQYIIFFFALICSVQFATKTEPSPCYFTIYRLCQYFTFSYLCIAFRHCTTRRMKRCKVPLVLQFWDQEVVFQKGNSCRLFQLKWSIHFLQTHRLKTIVEENNSVREKGFFFEFYIAFFSKNGNLRKYFKS